MRTALALDLERTGMAHGPILDLVAPAKINLTLSVLGKRADGYHELRSLMAPVNLFDRLRLEPLPEPGRIEVEAFGSAHVTGGEANLCHKAARYYFDRTGVRGGAAIRVEKRIPVGAGLAGGSSDAAATLMGLERLYGRELAQDARIEAAFAVGADVPFFFCRGAAWVTGIGERVEPVRMAEPLWLALVHPGVFLSTGTVFSRHNKELTTGGRLHNITQFDFQGVAAGLHNDLEDAACALEPAIAEAKRALRDAGCRAVSMTGSGAAVFGLCSGEADARRLARAVAADAPGAWRVEVAHTLTRAPQTPEREPNAIWGVGKR